MEEKKGLRAEWSVWEYDFKRMDALITKAHELMIALQTDWRQLYSLSAALHEFYRTIRPFQDQATQARFDSKFQNLRELTQPIMTSFEKKWYRKQMKGEEVNMRLPPEIFFALDELFNQLYDLRQKSNLGVPAHAVPTEREKLNRAFGLK